MKVFGKKNVKFCLTMAVAAALLSAGCEDSKKKISAEKPQAQISSPRVELPPSAYVSLDNISPEVVFRSFPQTRLPENESIKQTVGKLLSGGLKLQAQGKLDEALRKYESARMYAPDSPRVLKALGMIWMVKRDYDKAANYFRMSLDVDPDDLQVQVNLGRVYLMQNRPEDALYCFRAALLTKQASPKNIETAYAVLYRSRLLEKLGYYTAAMQSYDYLEKLVKANWSSYQDDSVIGDFILKPERFMIARGNLYDQLQEPQKALAEYKKALARDRNAVKVGIKVFEIYVQLGDYAQAEQLLMEFAQQDEYANYLGRLAMILAEKTRDADMPLRMWKKFRRQNPTSTVFAFALAGAAEVIQAWPQEKAILTDILKSMPDAPKAAKMLAEMSIKSGHVNECMERMAELIVSNVKALDSISAAMDVLVRQDDAARLLDEFSVSPAGSDPTMKAARDYVSAILAQKLNLNKRSEKLFEAAIDADPKFVPAYVSLLTEEWIKKNPARTDALLKQMKQNITGVDYFYVLGTVQIVRGAYADAIQSLLKARELDESSEIVIMKLSQAYELEARKTTDSSKATQYSRDNEDLLQMAIELRPDKLDAYQQLFEKYINRLDTQKSADIAVQVIKNIPQSPEGLIMAAETYLVANDRKRAKAVIDDISKRWPDDPRVGLLKIRYSLGQHAGLIPRKSFETNYKALKQLIEKSPSFAPAYELAGRLLGMVLPADYTQSAEYFAKAHQLAPADFSYAREYVMSLMRARDYKTALPLAESLHKESPRSIVLKRTIISCLDKMNDEKAALQRLEEWRRAAPEDKTYVEWMLNIYVSGKEYDKAVALLDSLQNVSDTPNYPAAWVDERKFDIFLVQQDYDKAFELIRREQMSDLMRNVVLLMDAMADAKKYDEALSFLDQMQKRICQDEKDETFVERVKALRYYILSRADRLDEFKAELVKEKPTPALCSNVYAALMSGKHYDEALTLLEKWKIKESFNPDDEKKTQLNSWCNEMTVATYLAMYDYDKAENALQNCMADDGQKSWYYYYNATILIHKGQHEDAALMLQRALAQDPKNAILKNDLAYQLAVINHDLKNAEKYARECLQEKGFEPAYMDTLAWVFYKDNQAGRAGELLLKVVPTPEKIAELLAEAQKEKTAITAEEINPIIVDHLADVLEKLGWSEMAKKYWQAAVNIAKQWPLKTPDIEQVMKSAEEKLQRANKKK